MTNTLTRRARILLGRLLNRALLAVQPADLIPGLHPVYVRRTGLGCELAVDSLVEEAVVALMAEVAEDPEGVADEATYLLATDGPERDALLEALVERLGGGTLRLGGAAVKRLSDQLTTVASVTPLPIRFPRQPNRKAA